MREPKKSLGGHLGFFAILKVCPAKPWVQTWLWLRIFLAFCFASPMVRCLPASSFPAHQWWDRRSVFLCSHTHSHCHSSLSAWDWWCQERQMCFAFWIRNSHCFADSLDLSSQLWHSFTFLQRQGFLTFTFLLTVQCAVILTLSCCKWGRNKVRISCKREWITPSDA